MMKTDCSHAATRHGMLQAGRTRKDSPLEPFEEFHLSSFLEEGTILHKLLLRIRCTCSK
jgi:hypothetical protein